MTTPVHRETKICSTLVLLFSMIAMLIVQKSLRPVARNAIRLMAALSLIALSLILTASPSQAGLGWTLEQFKQQYGEPVLDPEQIAGRVGYVFKGEDYIIAAFFRNTQVSRILYICRGDSVFDWGKAKALLVANAPDAIWEDASKNEADSFHRVNGTKDGVETYYASLTDDRQMLAIWTKEDDEAGTKPRLDLPLVSSVAGSNEKNTDPGTAAPVPSMDSELTPEKKSPGVAANPTAPSPAQRPASAHALRTKTAKAKLRSDVSHREIFHVANFNAKTRSTASSHRLVEGQPSSPSPIMNAGTGLYNSDNTQPFKNLKKAAGQ